ncbi:MAG TPA: HAD family hydrolase [Nitrospirota bacterium]|nr:HAD family hydrolase [Nitrospirota bacterium]
MNRAVFFDRDGTVNAEVGYLSDLKQLVLIPGAGKAIKRLNDAGLKVVLVTNQSGVARGYFTEEFVRETHALLERMLQEEGARIDGIYYCPHHPRAGNSSYTRECNCRKPGTGLLDQAARELDVRVDQSFVVGDKWSDVELGQRAGAASILVQTGFAHDDPGNVRPDRVREPDYRAPTIGDAVDWILNRVESGQ